MDPKMKGSPVPEPAEVRAPHARRPLRPVVRAMVPIGLAAGLSVAGISLWAAAEPSHDPSCARPGSSSTAAGPFEVLRAAWSKVTRKRYIPPVATATPPGSMVAPPPIVPTSDVALGGEPPVVAMPPAPSASASAKKPKPKPPIPKIVPTRPLPHLAGDVAEPELPSITPPPPRRDVPLPGGLKAPEHPH